MLEQFLKTNKNVRKIFGKKELEIIFRQRNGFALTQSQKNRLSRDIRPKFRFIQEASQFVEEFEIKKDSETKEIIKKGIRIIKEDELKDRILAILLFGSHVKGTVTPRSDIDICVLLTHISLTEATRFRIRIAKEFSEKVDIQVFNILPQKIKRSIAKNHRVLYKNKRFNNVDFIIHYIKDEDYFIRMQKIRGNHE